MEPIEIEISLDRMDDVVSEGWLPEIGEVLQALFDDENLPSVTILLTIKR